MLVECTASVGMEGGNDGGGQGTDGSPVSVGERGLDLIEPASDRRVPVGGAQRVDGPVGAGLREQEVGEGQVAHRLVEATPHEAASVRARTTGRVHRNAGQVVSVSAPAVTGWPAGGSGPVRCRTARVSGRGRVQGWSAGLRVQAMPVLREISRVGWVSEGGLERP